jgi:hypothetical protein
LTAAPLPGFVFSHWSGSFGLFGFGERMDPIDWTPENPHVISSISDDYDVVANFVSTPLGVGDAAAVADFALLPGVPNPFRYETVFSFSVPRASGASLTIVDLAGRRVKALWSGAAPGTRRVSWNGTDERGHRVTSGIYFALLRSGGELRARRVCVVD